MSKCIRHDPREGLPAEEADRMGARMNPVATMTPKQLEQWVAQNCESPQKMRTVITEMALVINALANERR